MDFLSTLQFSILRVTAMSKLVSTVFCLIMFQFWSHNQSNKQSDPGYVFSEPSQSVDSHRVPWLTLLHWRKWATEQSPVHLTCIPFTCLATAFSRFGHMGQDKEAAYLSSSSVFACTRLGHTVTKRKTEERSTEPNWEHAAYIPTKTTWWVLFTILWRPDKAPNFITAHKVWMFSLWGLMGF